jgi:hypothetical protein
MIKKIGSQSRESLEESGYKIVYFIKECGDKAVILEYIEDGIKEIWILNDQVAGYCIEINGEGYEFVRKY